MSRGRGGPSFTLGPSAAAGAEGRGLAPSRVMRSEGGGGVRVAGEWGGTAGAVPGGVGYVAVTSAREREREEPTRQGLGDGADRTSEGGSE